MSRSHRSSIRGRRQEIEHDATRESLHETLGQIFAAVDSDNDGFITKSQFSTFLSELGLSVCAWDSSTSLAPVLQHPLLIVG